MALSGFTFVLPVHLIPAAVLLPLPFLVDSFHAMIVNKPVRVVFEEEQ